MIHRNIEKALNLLAVQIHRQDAGGAGGNQQIGDQLGGDGHAGLVLAVLAGVAVKRHHRSDTLGRRAAGGVDHDQQFDQVVIARRTGRLDDVNILPPDVRVDLHEGLAIGKARDGRLAKRRSDRAADFLSERTVGVAGKDL